jgi:regulator of replication initiation timing
LSSAAGPIEVDDIDLLLQSANGSASQSPQRTQLELQAEHNSVALAAAKAAAALVSQFEGDEAEAERIAFLRDQLAEINTSTTNTIQELLEENQELAEENNGLVEENDELVEDNELLRRHIAQMVDEPILKVSMPSPERPGLTEEAELNRDQAVQFLCSQVDASSTAIEELAEENEFLREENEVLRSGGIRDAPADIADGYVLKLRERVEYLERKLQKFAEANQELYEENKKCEEENEALRKGNESEAVQYLYGQLEQFNAENEELKSNNEKHAERTAELNAKLGDYQEANQSLFDENEQLTDEADTLSERLIAFYQANQELFEQAEELAEELDVLRKGNTDDTVKYLYNQVEQLSTRLQGAHGENMELSDRLEEAYTRLQGALATVSYLQAQRTSNASSETEILEDKYRCMEIECETLREVVAHQEASMANLRQLHADSRAEQQGYASFATAPQLPWCSLRSTTRSSVQMH